MERLTERRDGWVMRNGCHWPCRTCHVAGCADISTIIERLAAYEDTGLMPEEVTALQASNQELKKEALRAIKHFEAQAQSNYKPFREAGELAVAALRTQADTPPNAPLTLEELLEMDGEPVWVEIPTGRVAEWCISKFDPLMNRVRFWCSGGGWFDGRNVGKSLFVYRRRPEEGTT